MNIITAEDHRLLCETIAGILCLPVEAISPKHILAFGLGQCDEGASCVRWPVSYSSIASGYAAGGNYSMVCTTALRGGR